MPTQKNTEFCISLGPPPNIMVLRHFEEKFRVTEAQTSVKIIHCCVGNMLGITFLAIKHSRSALAVSPYTGRLAGAFPCLVFALASCQSPVFKFFPVGSEMR